MEVDGGVPTFFASPFLTHKLFLYKHLEGVPTEETSFGICKMAEIVLIFNKGF